MIVTSLLDDAARTWAMMPESTMSIWAVAPIGWVTAMGMAFVMLVVVIILGLKMLPRTKVVSSALTWDCGYARPTARIQYTGSSFGQTLVNMFAFILWPKTHLPAIRSVFAAGARFKSNVPDTVLDRMVLPLFYIADRYLPVLRILQQGKTHLYVLYILVIVIMLLIWGTTGVNP